MVIIGSVAMIASIPFVIGFFGDAKERARVSDRAMFRLDQAVPPEPEVFLIGGVVPHRYMIVNTVTPCHR